jgi:hypothetical protein
MQWMFWETSAESLSQFGLGGRWHTQHPGGGHEIGDGL